MTSKKSSDLSTLFIEVQKRALAFPVQLAPLADDRAQHIGLLIYRDDAAVSVQAALKTVLSSMACPAAQTSLPAAQGKSGDFFSALPGGKALRNILADELARVGKTRLPCALILCGIHNHAPALPEGNKTLRELADTVCAAVGHTGTLARHAADTLALVLPGTNLGRGLYYAAEILKNAKRKLLPDLEPNRGPQVIMGVVVCHAFDNLNPEALLRLGEKELQRAGEKGPGAICHFMPRSEGNFCQVTVEERAELLGFLHRNDHP